MVVKHYHANLAQQGIWLRKRSRHPDNDLLGPPEKWRHLGPRLTCETFDKFVQVGLLGVDDFILKFRIQELRCQVEVPISLVREWDGLLEEWLHSQLSDSNRQRTTVCIPFLWRGERSGFVQAGEHFLNHFNIICFDTNCGELKTVKLSLEVRMRL